MELTVSGLRISRALQSISGVFKSSGLKEDCYTHVLFTLKPEGIVINSVNERITTTEEIFEDVDVSLEEGVSEFQFLLEAGPVTSYFKNVTGNVKIKLLENGSVELKAKNGKYKTVWLRPRGYPTIFKAPTENAVRIDSNLFVPMLKRAFYFSGSDEFRPFIESARITMEKDSLEMITTDRFKIFRCQSDFSYESERKDLLVSDAAGKILYKFLEYTDDNIEISISNDRSRTYISFDNVTISDRIIEDHFPDCRPIFNAFKPKYEAEHDKSEFMKAIKSTEIVADSPSVVYTMGSPASIESEFISTRKSFSVDVNSVSGGVYEDEVKFSVKRSDIFCCVSNIVGSKLKIQIDPDRHVAKLFNPERPKEFIICAETARLN